MLAYVAQIAIDGGKVVKQNFHSTVARKDLHSACPFGTVGVYYAYASGGATELYLLGCANHYQFYFTATARLAHVP